MITTRLKTKKSKLHIDILNNTSDYHQYLKEGICIKWICSHIGCGCFALRDYSPKEFIGEFTGEKISSNERKNILNSQKEPSYFSYLYFLKNLCINGDMKSPISYINDSKKNANATMKSINLENHPDRIGLFAKATGIKEGQQILYDYTDCNDSIINMPWRKKANIPTIFNKPRGIKEIESPHNFCYMCQRSVYFMINENSEVAMPINSNSNIKLSERSNKNLQEYESCINYIENNVIESEIVVLESEIVVLESETEDREVNETPEVENILEEKIDIEDLDFPDDTSIINENFLRELADTDSRSEEVIYVKFEDLDCLSLSNPSEDPIALDGELTNYDNDRDSNTLTRTNAASIPKTSLDLQCRLSNNRSAPYIYAYNV